TPTRPPTFTEHADGVAPLRDATPSQTSRQNLGLTLGIPIGAYHEIYVAPELSHHEQHRIEDAALPVTGPLAAAFLLGALLIAVCALVAPRPRMGRAGGALIVLAVLAMAVAEGLPGARCV
ncbi:hypothetical protein, partial [Nocardia sp. NPDC005366]|uniref:hypothetical protein n=1 Tax=Nocardia sp. NPDC005366 TaxID=3156878 RepID=UPI0033BD67D1